MNSRREKAFYELALLYAADLDEQADYPLLEYSVITTCVRHHLAGISRKFLHESVKELAQAKNIIFKFNPNEKN